MNIDLRKIWTLLLLGTCCWQLVAASPAWAAAASFAGVIEEVEPKIVKIYGAGGYPRTGTIPERHADFRRGAHPDRMELRARYRLHHGHAQRRPEVRRQITGRRSAPGTGRVEDRGRRAAALRPGSSPRGAGRHACVGIQQFVRRGHGRRAGQRAAWLDRRAVPGSKPGAEPTRRPTKARSTCSTP